VLRSPLRVVLVAVLLLAACAAPLHPVGVAAPEVRITLLQVNDLYVLEPVDEGRRGGLARLATLVKRLRRDNPATLVALAGDLISPSAVSTLLRGQHMIAGMNAVGLDVATFGNHLDASRFYDPLTGRLKGLNDGLGSSVGSSPRARDLYAEKTCLSTNDCDQPSSNA